LHIVEPLASATSLFILQKLPRACDSEPMSEMSNERIPEWDTADRMRKALRVASIEVRDMADYLGVSRSSVSNWINGRIRPSKQTMRLWALRCGVPMAWLTGDGSGNLRSRTPLRVAA
jgi:DNA-binding transcriptional regulator YiaG